MCIVCMLVNKPLISSSNDSFIARTIMINHYDNNPNNITRIFQSLNCLHSLHATIIVSNKSKSMCSPIATHNYP